MTISKVDDIPNIQKMLERVLPHFRYTINDDETILSIRKKAGVCQITIQNGRRVYRYKSTTKAARFYLPLFLSLFIISPIGMIVVYFVLDGYYAKKARKIGTEVAMVLKADETNRSIETGSMAFH